LAIDNHDLQRFWGFLNRISIDRLVPDKSVLAEGEILNPPDESSRRHMPTQPTRQASTRRPRDTAVNQIAESLRERIERGEWQPHRRIPSQSELADEIGVPGRIVGLAIANLRARSYLRTTPYKGSYVRSPKDWQRAIE
jgi:GntR family transcriptional regulator